MLVWLKGSAKAVAALVVGFGVSYLSARGLEMDPVWVATATGILTSIIVWVTRNAPAVQ